MKRIVSDIHFDFTAKHEAFSYQHEAFMAIKDLPYAAIFHEQGLGKTKIAIDLLLYWLTKRDIDTVMIVTKKQLVANWCSEFQEHTHLHPSILSTDRKSNFYVLNSASNVIITNFETISTEKARIKLFLQTRNVAIILDESTKIKNSESKITQDFFEIAPLAQIRVIMTGTPVANRPYDIWSQVFFLDFGESLGKNFADFKSANNLTNDLEQNEVRRKEFENSLASIYKKISAFTVRETKRSGVITLPNKIYHNLYDIIETKQKEMYEKVRTEMELEVRKGGTDLLDESQDAIKRLLRLVQITSNPRLLDERYHTVSAKESMLDSLIKDIIGRNEKVIVWSIFTDNIDFFCKKYKQFNSVKITGKMPIDERNKSVEHFKNGDAKILFATPQSAKEGLTLTVANNAVFYDRGFNLDDYLQAQDRIHRISQQKECNIYNLMITDSIDIWVDYLLKAKQSAAFLAQGDITLEGYRDIADYSFGNIVRQILNIEIE